MALHHRENQYPGVNAHLNSHLQQHSWLGFHNSLIIYLKGHLNETLPAGYFADNEESLQIAARTPVEGMPAASHSRPDVLIHRDTTTPQTAASSPATGIAPTMTLPAAQTIEAVDYYDSIVISLQVDEELVPVTRIELLSPGNKPPGANHTHYLANRNETLQSGIRLLEIDFLHESRPALKVLPSYRDREPGAFPYYLLVTDPHPSLAEGKLQVYGFGVDDPIPRINVPLAGEQTFSPDLNGVYSTTFATTRSYGLRRVDYAQEPVNFERYSPEDQARIRARLAEITARLEA